MKKIVFVIFLFSFHFSSAQFSNRIWCFGDSAGIDFSNPNNPTTFTSYMDSRGSCCSIADSSNQLLFYAHSDWNQWWNTAPCYCAQKITNRNHSGMINGDSLIGEIWYDQMLIIPFPTDSNKFYLFHLDATNYWGMYYSIIDMTQDGGNGAVISKNVSLSNSELFIGVAAIKHANGRDWWVIYHNSNASTGGNPTNDFCILNITPSGISSPLIQSIGELCSTNLGALKFSHKGNRLAFVNTFGLIELFDFDRCTGLFSNPVIVNLENESQPGWDFSCEFSHSDSVLYVSCSNEVSALLQFNLYAPNIASSLDTIAAPIIPAFSGGNLKLAADNKIYWSRAATYLNTFNYPYPDSAWAFQPCAMNLSVINNPDSLGAACNFQLDGFYLGGARSYYGLPNNPDYNMRALGGSLCDTLGYPNHINDFNKNESILNIFYHNDWQTAFINASGLKGSNCFLHVINSSGQEVFSEPGKIFSGYYTKDLQCANLKPGTYIVLIETEKDRLVKKFVKE